MARAKFSKITGGVYPTSVYLSFPNDALDIPDALYTQFQNGTLSAGFDVANGVVVAATAPVPTLAQNQAAMWEKIKAERTRRENGGVLVTVTAAVGATPAVTKWFHTDIPSRCKYLGGADQGANLAANLQWKTMDGTFVTMTPALITAIINAVADADRVNFANAETHKTNMNAAPDPTAYNFSTGWTAIY